MTDLLLLIVHYDLVVNILLKSPKKMITAYFGEERICGLIDQEIGVLRNKEVYVSNKICEALTKEIITFIRNKKLTELLK